MILYKNNSKLDQKVVTTIDGSLEYRRNCKFIKEKYYRMGDHVHFIESENLWYRVELNKIKYNSLTKKWELKNK